MRKWLYVACGVAFGAVLLFLCEQGDFYKTGAQFYQSCWERAHAGADSHAQSPDQAAQWASCQPAADAAFYEAGFIFAGNPEFAVTPQLTAVLHACPSQYNDMFAEDLWRVTVQMIQDSGGPMLRDKFLPANALIRRVLSTRWPHCATVARSNEFPRLVLRSGKWVFETECLPCKAEETAIEESTASKERAQETLTSMTEAEKKAAGDTEWAVLVAEANQPPACTAPAALMSDPKASKWEKDRAQAAAIISKECKIAQAGQRQRHDTATQ